MSPETSRFLQQEFNFNVTDLVSLGLSHLKDSEVVELAKREDRIVVTFDLDFGEIYHRREHGQFGVIVLRLNVQTLEIVHQTLSDFFRDQASAIDLDRCLVIIDETRARVIHAP